MADLEPSSQFIQDIAGGAVDFTGQDMAATNLDCITANGLCFRNANLRATTLRNAKLEKADLSCAIARSAVFDDAHLRGATLSRADLAHASFIRADLRDTTAVGAQLSRVDLSDALLEGADFSKADLTRANLHGCELRDITLNDATLTDAALDTTADLLDARWDRIVIQGYTYLRDDVVDGTEVLPFGMGKRLALLLRTQRLVGKKHDAMLVLLDSLKRAGVDARLEDAGGADTTMIRISVRSRQNAHVLLQVGSGICRLLDVGAGVDNLAMPESSSITREYIDAKFATAAEQSRALTEWLSTTVEGIIREDLQSIRISGLSDSQVQMIVKVAEEAGVRLEEKVIAEAVDAMTPLTNLIVRDLYEMKVPAPLRTFIEGMMKRLARQPDINGN